MVEFAHGTGTIMQSDSQQLAKDIDLAIVKINESISLFLDEVLHHPEFQKLEALWNGVKLLAECVPDERAFKREDQRSTRGSSDGILISLWNVKKEELNDDLYYSSFSSMDQNALYRKVYRNGLNVFGAIPVSLVVSDYEFDDRHSDIILLQQIAKVMSISFSVFCANASPTLFELDSYTQLPRRYNLLPNERGESIATCFSKKTEWNQVRSSSDFRFMSLCAPKMLMRRPYDFRRSMGTMYAYKHHRDLDDHLRFPYRETTHRDGSGFLWGAAAFGFAAVAITCYSFTNWLADIHGVPIGDNGGGRVPRLWEDLEIRDAEGGGTIFKPMTDCILPDSLEKELTELGIMALCHRPGTSEAVFCNTPSLYNSSARTDVDRQLSSMLQYTLCVARFAQIIKIMGHELVGSNQNAESIVRRIRDFLGSHTQKSRNADRSAKARQPLHNYDVKVKPTLGKDGFFDCDIMIQMHHDLDAVRLELQMQLGMETNKVS